MNSEQPVTNDDQVADDADQEAEKEEAPPPRPIDYSVAGARPKVYPNETQPSSSCKKLSSSNWKQSADYWKLFPPSSTGEQRAEDTGESSGTAAGVSRLPRKPGWAQFTGLKLPIDARRRDDSGEEERSTIQKPGWGGRFDGPKMPIDARGKYDSDDDNVDEEERSTVEIIHGDEQLRQQCDQAFAGRQQWQGQHEEGAEHQQTEDTGFEELLRDIPSQRTPSPVGLQPCPYCGRKYEREFMVVHETQCIENPAVAEERRDVKMAVEASAIDEWRSVPNPDTQSTWNSRIPDEKPAGAEIDHTITWQRYQWYAKAMDWDKRGTSTGGDGAAAAAASSSTRGFYNTDDTDDAMIPCEFCDVQLPFYAIEHHQEVCELRH